MKRFLAGVLTLLLMTLLIWSSLRRGPAAAERIVGSAEARDSLSGAEDRLQDLLASAQQGSVSAYLSVFAEPMRLRLEREVKERGRDAFAADLRHAAETRKSHAIFAPEAEAPTAARITVETVYADRNERQMYHLIHGPDGWLVADVETVRSHTPIARFGTPASYQEPEGVPVAGGAPVNDLSSGAPPGAAKNVPNPGATRSPASP
jgi:hypothetical protein